MISTALPLRTLSPPTRQHTPSCPAEQDPGLDLTRFYQGSWVRMRLHGKGALLAVMALAVVAAVFVIVAVHQDGAVDLQQRNKGANKNVEHQQLELRQQLRNIIKAVAPHNQKLQAAFPGEPKDELKVCEPWPNCCNWGKKTLTCYGVITEGVLAPHTCTPYPYCCGHSWDNCFDANGGERGLPKTSVDAPSPVQVQELIDECEGEEQLAQCLIQTQSCLDTETVPHATREYTIRHPWRETDACTCFKSSVYCSWPQSYQTCSPCPLKCQKKLFGFLNAARRDMSKDALSCPLFDGGEVGSMYEEQWRLRDEEDTNIDMSDPHSWGLDDRLGADGWANMDVDSQAVPGHSEGSEDNVGGEFYPPGGMYGHVYGARGRGRRYT